MSGWRSRNRSIRCAMMPEPDEHDDLDLEQEQQEDERERDDPEGPFRVVREGDVAEAHERR